MKKIFSLIVLSLLVFSFGLVSAKTLVAGKIYNYDFSKTIAGANVTISCAHGDSVNIENTTSLSDGTYAVEFIESKCDADDTVVIYATSGDLWGESGGDDVVNDKNSIPGLDVNLAIVNVPLVPEFGFFVGALTLLSAMVVFFVIRKE